MTFKVVKGQQD